MAILHQGVWYERLGARPLQEALCEQVKLSSAQRKRKKVRLFDEQILCFLPRNC